MNVMKIASLNGRQLSWSNLFFVSRLLDVAFAMSLASNFKDQFRRGTAIMAFKGLASDLTEHE